MNTHTGVVGFLELQKSRLIQYLISEITVSTDEEKHQLIGAGYNAACALNLMGLLPDRELQTIGLLITRELRPVKNSNRRC